MVLLVDDHDVVDPLQSGPVVGGGRWGAGGGWCGERDQAAGGEQDEQATDVGAHAVLLVGAPARGGPKWGLTRCS